MIFAFQIECLNDNCWFCTVDDGTGGESMSFNHYDEAVKWMSTRLDEWKTKEESK